MEIGVIVTDHSPRSPELAPAPVVPGPGADAVFRSVSAWPSVSEDAFVEPVTAGEASEESDPAVGSDVLFFDGECLFCQARVRWLQRRDRDGHLAFAPLQGALAAPSPESSIPCPQNRCGPRAARRAPPSTCQSCRCGQSEPPAGNHPPSAAMIPFARSARSFAPPSQSPAARGSCAPMVFHQKCPFSYSPLPPRPTRASYRAEPA